MNKYTSDNLLRIAKRYRNKKRSYLLVDPLQGKHMAASPKASLAMMECLGDEVARKYPKARVVIGFAETATAIGAAIAGRLGEDCFYIPTTREKEEAIHEWISFTEDHSHAVDQQICADSLSGCFAATNEIVIVDDEFSTGSTLVHIVDQLRLRYPEIRGKKIIAVSVISRLSAENLERMEAHHIEMISLLKLPEIDYEAQVKDIEAGEPIDIRKDPIVSVKETMIPFSFAESRHGILYGTYKENCEACFEELKLQMEQELSKSKRILVLGTEECMYPALWLGRAIEENFETIEVFCHATTRSPIGICSKEDYPIKEGYRLHSFYEEARETFLYNPGSYDAVIVVSDSGLLGSAGRKDIEKIFARHGAEKFYFLQTMNKAIPAAKEDEDQSSMKAI